MKSKKSKPEKIVDLRKKVDEEELTTDDSEEINPEDLFEATSVEESSDEHPKQKKMSKKMKKEEESLADNLDTDEDEMSDDENGGTEKVHYSKGQKIAIAGLIILIISTIGATLFFVFYKQKPTPVVNTTEPEEEQVTEPEKKPTLFAGLADGVMQSQATATALPLTVMIENLSTIRPQTGLDKASVVYEALAEGGITRFLAVFQGKELDKIGPVRSARNYYMDWAEEFHGLYIHAGGSQFALNVIKDYDFTDLNALTSDGKYFWRDTSELAPHNLYTKTDLLSVAARDKKKEPKASFNSWKFKDDAGTWIGKTRADIRTMQTSDETESAVKEETSAENTDTTTAEQDSTKDDEIYRQATEIMLDYSSPGYKVNWDYDKEANDYKRSNGGQPHTERVSGKQLRAKNIAIAKVKAKPLDATRLEMDTAAGGDAMVFHDGIVIEGTWKKPVRGDRMRFYDKDGAEIEFNRGNTWVEIIPPDKRITY